MTDTILTIGIPTWNRAEHLRRAVQSAARQIDGYGLPVEILISDNGSDDTTPEVIKALFHTHRCVRFRRHSENLGGAANFRAVGEHAQGEYLWFLGDDDVVLPGAVRAALEAIEQAPAVFLHCTVDYRAGPEPRLIAGEALELMNRYGWINLQGFMTTCMVRTQAWRGGVNGSNWPLYAPSAFAQSCVLLEQTVGMGERIVIIDRPMVATQDAQQTPETLKRWRAEAMNERYVLVVDALARLVEQGRLPPVETGFFQYHRSHLWSKIANDLIYFQLHDGRGELAGDPATWERLARMTGLLRDEGAAVAVRRRLLAVRQALAVERRIMREHSAAFDALGRALGELRDGTPLPAGMESVPRERRAAA